MSAVLDMPKRPPWKYSMTKQQVERTEEEMFENFLEKIYDEYKLSELSYFERNLEVISTNNSLYSYWWQLKLVHLFLSEREEFCNSHDFSKRQSYSHSN